MASTKLSRTAGTASNTYKATISAWVKRATTGTEHRIFTGWGGVNEQSVFTIVDDRLFYQEYNGSFVCNYQTNRLLRDTSAFYHLMVAIDTTLSTATDRVKIYINGLEQRINGGFSTDTQIAQNTQLFLSNYSSGQSHNVGARDSENYFDGSMSHVHLIDGTAYDASTFGETDATTGIWKPKTAPSVTYGTNGFFLKFENSGSMGTDSSPNGNNFTVNGSLTQTVDTPSNVFATLNPLDVSSLAGEDNTFSNGNLSVTDGAGSYIVAQSTLATSKGKYYWEVKINATTSSSVSGVGICDFDNFTRADGGANTAYGWIYTSNGSKRNNSTASSYGNSYTTNDIIGIALDMDNGYLYFSKNGVWQNSGDPTSGASGTGSAYGSISGTIGAHAYDGSSGEAHEFSFNFGNGYFGTTPVASAGSNGNGAIFEYDVPTGYYALNTKNINTYG